MTLEEAERKAEQAVEMGLITREQEQEYTHHLVETHKVINKDVSRGIAVPTDSNNDNDKE